MCDTVSGEPVPRAIQFVVEELSVCKPRVAIDCGVQIDIPAVLGLALPSLDGSSLWIATPVCSPTATVGDATDLLDIDVPRLSTDDRLRLSVRQAVGINESPMVQAQRRQVPCYHAPTDTRACVLKLEGDAR